MKTEARQFEADLDKTLIKLQCLCDKEEKKKIIKIMRQKIGVLKTVGRAITLVKGREVPNDLV